MLENKTILITGAFGLLGREMRDTFCEQGAFVLLGTRDEAKAEFFNRENAGRQNAKAVHLPADDEEGLCRAAALIIDTHGRIDGLVNNAYPVLDFKPVGEIPWSHWSTAATVSLAATESLSSFLVKNKDTTDISSIVNIASMYGLRAPQFGMYLPTQEPSAAYYGAIKAGVIGLTRYLAALWGPQSIRVNSVSPGGIANEQNPLFLERYNVTVPMRRMVTAKEVSSSVAFLLGEQATGITGTDTVIDGGKTIW